MEISELTNVELLLTYAAVMRELKQRGTIRSTNNPVSDIAESLCARALGLTLCPKSEMGCDATSADGTRFQIKSLRVTPHNSSTRLGALRDIDAKHFDFLVALYFDESFQLTAAYQIPHATVRRHVLWSKAQNAHILHAKKAVTGDPDCENILPRFAGVHV